MPSLLALAKSIKLVKLLIMPEEAKDKAEPRSAREIISEYIDGVSDVLRTLSLELYRVPEQPWEEEYAASCISDFLEGRGFSLKREAYGTPHGFEAVYQHKCGGRVVGFISEMDGLTPTKQFKPRNLQAIIGAGCAAAVAQALRERDIPGTVVVLGTPAEASLQGKAVMWAHGAFEELDACFMARPGEQDGVADMMAMNDEMWEFRGSQTVDSSGAFIGPNALDAAVLAYTNLAFCKLGLGAASGSHLQSSFPPTPRGSSSGSKCSLFVKVRTSQMSEGIDLRHRTEQCIVAAAKAIGCTAGNSRSPGISEMRNNPALAIEYQKCMELDQNVSTPFLPPSIYGTGLGPVSHKMPVLYPTFAPSVEGHQAQHRTPITVESVKSVEAHANAIKTMKGLAAVAWKFLANDDFAAVVRKDFAKQENLEVKEQNLEKEKPVLESV